MKLIVKNSNGEITEQEITGNLQFSPTVGDQYFFTDVENYTFSLTDNNNTLNVHFLDDIGERISVVLHDMAAFIQQNNPLDPFSIDTLFGISTNEAGDQIIENTLNNIELKSGEIVEALKEVLSMDGSTLASGAVIDDFQALLEKLEAAATGEAQSEAYNFLYDDEDDHDVTPSEPNDQDRPENYDDGDRSFDRSSGDLFINHDPTLDVTATASVDEDGVKTIKFTTNDIDGDTLTTNVTAINGTVSVENGEIVYKPNENYNGSDTITVTVDDGNGGSVTKTIDITVDPVNDLPTVEAVDTVYVNEDGIVSGRINASDIDGDSLTFTTTSDIEGLTLNPDGTYTFDADSYDSLDLGENKILEVPVTVSDGNGGEVQTTLTIDVAGVNNDISYVSETAGYRNVIGYYELDENGNPTGEAKVIIDDQNGMLGGTHLDDLNPNTEYGFFIIANGANQVDENSVITFDNSGDIPVLLIDGEAATKPVYHDTPSFNWDGKDHFVFESDGEGGTNINIEDLPHLGDGDFKDVVLNVNFEIADKIGDDLQARNDTRTVEEGNSITIDVLRNDRDGTGDELTITDVQKPVMLNGVEVGTADIINDKIVFTPNDELDKLSEGEVQTLSFKYTVSDGNLGEDTASVVLKVQGTNDGPIATDDIGIATETVLLQESFESLRSSRGWHVEADGEVTGDNGTQWDVTNGLEVQEGIVARSSDGNAHMELDAYQNSIITTNLNTAGQDSIRVEFDYNPRQDHSSSSDMKFTVDGVDYHVSHNGTVTPEGNVTIDGPDSNGWYSVSGEFDVDSDSVELSFAGEGRSDGLGALLDNINVVGIINDSLKVDEDTSLTINASNLLANDTDIDGDTLTIASVQNATNGTVSLDANGNVVFTPEANYNGPASFTYTISDGHGGEDTATVTLNVDSVNDSITQVVDSDNSVNEVDENVESGTYTGVTLDAADVDGDAITYTLPDDVPFKVFENGQVVTDGAIDFESNESYTFTATATSSDGTQSTTEVTINVNDIEEDLSADEVISSIDIGEAVENTTVQIDLDAINEQGLIDNGDGTYFKPTYEETAKLYKTEEIEIGAAKSIRLDDAPDHGTVEVNIDGEWTEIVLGQEYDADIEVRFTPDTDALNSTRDVGIGTFGDNVGERGFTERVELSDWGDVADDGRSVTYTEGDLSVRTSVIQNGSEQQLGTYDRSGSHVGAGIGDQDRSGLSRGEVMKVEFDGEDINQVEFQLDGLGGYFDESSRHATEVQITAYDKNGNEIDTQGGFRESGEYDDVYTFTTTVPVAYFELTTEGSNGTYVVQNMTLSRTVVDEVTFTAIADDGTELTLTSDINIEAGMGTTSINSLVPVSDESMTREVRVVDEDAMAEKGAIQVDGTWVVQTGTEIVETPTEEVVDSYEYPIDLTAQLTDTDGSESLSDITVDNLPQGATLTGDNVTDNGDGTYNVSVDENGEANATLESSTELSEEQLNEVTATVTSTENSTGDTFTSTITGGGELSFLDDTHSIDFGEIAQEIDGIHTLNLESEPNHTLTLDVDDIVNANNDHEMVIVGHDGDVIDLEGEGWIKQADHISVDGEEGEFDVYSSVSSDGTTANVYVESDVTVQIQSNDDFF